MLVGMINQAETIWSFPFVNMQTPDLLIDYDMLRRTFSIVQQEDVRNISAGIVEYCLLNYDYDTAKLLDISMENR